MKKILLGLVAVVVLLAVVFISPALITSTLNAESKVVINKSPEEVWEKFVDTDNMGKWLIGFKSIEKISGETNKPGSKYRIVIEENGQTFEAVETVKEVIKNKKFAFELDGDMVTDDIEIVLIDKGLTTELVQRETIVAKGFLYKALFYWMQSSMSKRSQDNLDNLKKFVEES